MVEGTTTVPYTYDADGNLLSRGGPTPAYFQWDSANRLTCLGSTQGNPCADEVFSYDPDGQRLTERTTSTGSTRILLGDLFEWDIGTATGTAHVVAFGRRIATATITGAGLRPSWLPPVWRVPIPPRPLELGILTLGLLALLVLLVRTRVLAYWWAHPVPAAITLMMVALTAAPPAAWAGGGGGGMTVTVRYVFTDPLGTGVLVTGPDGTEVQRRVFEPFGKMIASSTPTEPTAQLFTGHRFEAQSALYDFGARWYDPDTGRFLSVDPIVQALGDPQTHNAYGFVRNNPLSNVDADGMGLFQWLGRLSAKGWWGHALSILIGVVVGAVIGGIVGGVVLGGSAGTWVGAALGGELALPEGVGVGALVGATVGDAVVQAGASQAATEEGGVGSTPIFSGIAIGDVAMRFGDQVSEKEAIEEGQPWSPWGPYDPTQIEIEIWRDLFWLPFATEARSIGGLIDFVESLIARSATGTVVSASSKAAARAAIAELDLPEGQAQAALRAVKHATATSTIEIVREEGGTVVVRIIRAGRDGYQAMESTITQDGIKTVVQKAWDAAGRLVHLHPDR